LLFEIPVCFADQALKTQSFMRRLLLISFFFPPSLKVGAVRAGGLAKHLPKFGWEPIVLTPSLPERIKSTAVIETGHRDVFSDLKTRLGFGQKSKPARQLDFKAQKDDGTARFHNGLIKWVRSVIMYPDQFKGWVPFGVKAVEEFAQRERVDAILSTSPANSGHVIAARAKTLWNCPLVADLRDLWSDAGTTPWGLDFLQRSLEKRTLRSADLLVTVSDPWVECLQQTFPGKRVVRITNGFDPDDFPPSPSALTSTFSITYTGYLYDGQSDPTPVFEVLGELLAKGALPRNDVKLRFYGTSEGLPGLANRCGLQDVLELHGWVSREESLQRQRESQVLLLFGKSIPSYSGCYPAKLFEYLASRRPILAVGGPPGVTSQLLEETGSGLQAFSKDAMRDFFVKSYNEFRTAGQVQYQGVPSLIDGYTHSAMAEKFAGVLDGLLPR
jgi:glycosyltransferase involved in cell wall biosynthesis